MARGIRIEYPGAFHHLMAQGNRRERIFREDDDRRFFCQTLREACQRTGWKVQAWVLMSNHYHFMLETPEANLVAGMKWLQNTYTRCFTAGIDSGAGSLGSLQSGFERRRIGLLLLFAEVA